MTRPRAYLALAATLLSLSILALHRPRGARDVWRVVEAGHPRRARATLQAVRICAGVALGAAAVIALFGRWTGPACAAIAVLALPGALALYTADVLDGGTP